jgi:hypothetical protein
MSFLICALLILTVPAAPAQQVLASGTVRIYVDDGTEGPSADRDSARLPSNIVRDAAYTRDVDAMLRSSPTFRAQCARIARAPHLRVSIHPSVLPPSQSAATHVTRQPGGRLAAEVEIGPLGDPVQLIAHEFEHILEQLDGVDLPALSDRPGTGVRSDPRSGSFETERAIAVGRRVAREVSIVVARR